MALPISGLTLKAVKNYLTGLPNTLDACHTAAETNKFDPSFNTEGSLKTLKDFRNYDAAITVTGVNIRSELQVDEDYLLNVDWVFEWLSNPVTTHLLASDNGFVDLKTATVTFSSEDGVVNIIRDTPDIDEEMWTAEISILRNSSPVEIIILDGSSSQENEYIFPALATGNTLEVSVVEPINGSVRLDTTYSGSWLSQQTGWQADYNTSIPKTHNLPGIAIGDFLASNSITTLIARVPTSASSVQVTLNREFPYPTTSFFEGSILYKKNGSTILTLALDGNSNQQIIQSFTNVVPTDSLEVIIDEDDHTVQLNSSAKSVSSNLVSYEFVWDVQPEYRVDRDTSGNVESSLDEALAKPLLTGTAGNKTLRCQVFRTDASPSAMLVGGVINFYKKKEK